MTMEILVVKNYEEMSARAAEIFGEIIRKKPNCVIGLATGSTPVGLYGNLAKACDKGEVDFSAVRTVNLDEYYPIPPTTTRAIVIL